MRQFDKIFAGLILLAMFGFWVVIAPATFVARTSEAMPVALGSLLEEPVTNQTATERNRPRETAEEALIQRLKIRDRDTPSGDFSRFADHSADQGPAPADGELQLQDPGEAPDIPVFY